MKLIVDYSVMMHQSWHQMFSPDYQPTFRTEQEEFTFNLARNLFYLKCRFKPDQMILAMDDKTNWRKFWVKNYYETIIKIYRENTADNRPTFYYEFDGTYMKFEKFLSTGHWKATKLKLAEVKALNNFSDFERFESIDDINVIRSMEVYTAVLNSYIPYYKGKRSLSDWKGKMDRNEFKKLSANIAPKIASVIEAHLIRVDYAEGDDIIAKLVMFSAIENPDEAVVVCSVDQDLYQLQLQNPNMQYYNPIKRKIISLPNDEVRWKLLCKIAGGDGGDNISGMMIEGKSLSEVKTRADGQVVSGKSTVGRLHNLCNHGATGTDMTNPAYEWLRKNAERDTFYKNMILIYLKNMPESLQQEIASAYMRSEIATSEHTYASLGFGAKTKIEIMNAANADIKNSMEIVEE